MTEENVHQNIAKYEHFINDVLKEDLRVLEQRMIKINAEISDLTQQRHTLKVITDKTAHPDGFKSQVNIGCNFFMEASVPDTSSLLINIGLDHYLEFSSNEASKYLDVLIKALEKKAEELQNKAAEAKAHIKLMLFNLGELYEVTSG